MKCVRQRPYWYSGYCRKVAELFKGAYPVRHKGIHFINFPVGLDALVALAKTFLPAKIANQVGKL